MMLEDHRRAWRCLAFGFCLLFLLCAAAEKLHSYSFQFQTLLLLDIQAGLGNFATDDLEEVASDTAFSGEFGIERFGIMPQLDVVALLVMRSSYLLRFQVIFNNLRSQQSNVAFGLGNENSGLLFGLAQGLSVSSQSRKHKASLGFYMKTFYNPQGIMDLQLEAVVLTNTLENNDSNGLRSIYLYLQALFLLSQLRIGIVSTVDVFEAMVTGPSMFQVQAKLVLGGSGADRLFAMDFYLLGALIVNGNSLDSLLCFGVGLKLWYVGKQRTTIGFFLEIMPFTKPLYETNRFSKESLALTLGLNLKFRVSRKELWSPEVIPR